MALNLSIENVLIQVRAKLTADGVKLWLPPYYLDGIGSIETEIENLAERYSVELGIPRERCEAAVNELQFNAIDKLRSKTEFEQSGIGTLKIRVPNRKFGTELLTIHCKLSNNGKHLQELIAEKLNVPDYNVKLISGGKVLQLHYSLEEQSIKNNQQLMAIITDHISSNSSSSSTPGTSTGESTVNNDENIYAKVQRIKADAELLMKSNINQYMQMEDQSGNPVYLPPSEKKSIALALALHEKGRASLSKKNYNEALILFLEADEQFNQCNSQILQSVDNYALLNLDIVWCYFCVRSIMQLPDAERRLNICEHNFKRIYGENLDRVVTLKGSAGNEKTLIMRMHLLQAIIYFHQNRRSESLAMLTLVESELNMLKVDEESIAILVSMGYTMTEARIGLRACDGDIDRATTYILERKETRKAARKKGNQANILSGMIGNDRNDEEWVNPKNLQQLIDMGFRRELSILALRKTKNDIMKSITMLQENRTMLQEELSKDTKLNNNVLEEFTRMGFPSEIVKMVSKIVDNDFDKILNYLLKMQENEGTLSETIKLLEASLNDPENNQNPSTSTGNNSTDTDNIDANKAGPSTEKKLKKAYKKLKDRTSEELKTLERFGEDLSNVDDEYLDLSLDDEENILNEYKKYLNM